jgi:hypothetical protein
MPMCVRPVVGLFAIHAGVHWSGARRVEIWWQYDVAC